VSASLVFYEGVMQTPRNQPILEGFRLVQALAISNRIVVATSGKKERVERQLRTERIQDNIVDVLDAAADLPPLPLWQRQLEIVRSRGPVSLVLAADPTIVQWAVEVGVVALLFAHPGHSGPPIRPVQGNRSWEELLEELEARP
jgi:hypothetical protein